MPTPGRAALDAALRLIASRSEPAPSQARLRVMEAHYLYDARIMWKLASHTSWVGPSHMYSEGASLSWLLNHEYEVCNEDMHLLRRVVDEEEANQEAQLFNLADMQVGDVAVIRARDRTNTSSMRYDGAIVLFVFNDRGDGFTFVCIDPGTSQARRGLDTWVCRSGTNLHAFRFQKINMTLEGLV